MNKVILYIATSWDGFIADINGKVDWLPQPRNEHDLEIVGYNKLIKRVDRIVMGSNSFKQIMGFGEWAWREKHTYVFSAQSMEVPLSCITLTNDNPPKFIEKMRNQSSNKDIWLLGGAALAQSFARDKLIDEIHLTIIPKNLDEGISLGVSFDDFKLKEEKPLIDGMIQKIYLREGNGK